MAEDGKVTTPGPKTEVPNKDQKAMTPEEMKAHIEKLETQNKELLTETIERRHKLKKLEQDREDSEKKRLEEESKFKELYEGSKPKLERLKGLEDTFTKLLDAEISSIPDDKRDLIPQFESVEKRYEWLMTAKSKGIFAAPKKDEGKKTNPPSYNGKPATEGTIPEFLNWGADDARLLDLNSEDYLKWKSHRANKQRGAVSL